MRAIGAAAGRGDAGRAVPEDARRMVGGEFAYEEVVERHRRVREDRGIDNGLLRSAFNEAVENHRVLRRPEAITAIRAVIVPGSAEPEAVAQLVEHHRLEIVLVERRRAVGPEIPGGKRAVEGRGDVGAGRVHVPRGELVGQGRVVERVRRARPEILVYESAARLAEDAGPEGRPVGVDGNGHRRRNLGRPDVHSRLEGRLGRRIEAGAVVHGDGGRRQARHQPVPASRNRGPRFGDDARLGPVGIPDRHQLAQLPILRLHARRSGMEGLP